MASTRVLIDARNQLDGSVPMVPPVDVEVPLYLQRALGEPASAKAERLQTSDLIDTATFQRISRAALAARDRFLDWAADGGGSEAPRQDDERTPHDTLQLFRGDDQYHLWREILYGQTLADALMERGVREILWQPGFDVQGAPLAPVLAQALQGALPPSVTWTPLPNGQEAGPGTTAPGGIGRRLDNAYRKVRNRLERLTSRGPRGGRCLAVFSTQQWKRFSAALEGLRQVYGDDLAFWYLGRLTPDLRAALKRAGIRGDHLPMPPTVDADLARAFQDRQQRWMQQGRHELADELGCPAVASQPLESLFSQSFGFTLPRAAQWLRELQRALAACRPELVVGSAAFTFTCAMPMWAARRAGVPSMALTHTYISGDSSPLASDYLACRNAFERRGFQESFPRDDGVVACHDACDVLSYQVDSSEVRSSGDRRRVALLTAAPQLQHSAMGLHELGPCADALRRLCLPPEDLDDLDWVFKFHPRFDITRALEGYRRSENVEIYPATASVHDLLADCWLAVLVNHVGGVAVDARLAGRPLLFLDSAHYCYPNVDPAMLEVETVESCEALWQRVRTLRDDPTAYDDARAQTQRFVEQRLRLADDSLSQCLERGLAAPGGSEANASAFRR